MKLHGKAKAAFLKRMAAGRRKVRRNATGALIALGPLNPGTKRNDPELAAAAEAAEEFHGRPARSVREVIELDSSPRTLMQMARMVEVKVQPFDAAGRPRNEAYAIDFTHTKAYLAVTPDRKQFFIVEGDTRIPEKLLREILGRTPDGRQFETLGLCISVTYYTKNSANKSADDDYEHQMGEDGGARPVIGYDTRNGKLFFLGGTYHVEDWVFQ